MKISAPDVTGCLSVSTLQNTSLSIGGSRAGDRFQVQSRGSGLLEIFGHCRFSWFGISDTGREVSDIEDARKKLWNPVRMAIRFHFFENILLPSLAAQTDRNFTLLVTVSEDMPELYQRQLDKSVAPYPFVRLNRTLSRDYAEMIKPFMLETTADGKVPAVHFRIDDDDGLCATYIERLRRDAARVDVGGLVSYPRGIVAFIDDGTVRHGVHVLPYNAQGMARVAGPGMLRSPMQMQHLRMGQRAPSYVDPTFTNFYYAYHYSNNAKGYASVLHASSVTPRLRDRIVADNPELGAGEVTTPKCEELTELAFPFTTGAALRGLLQDTTEPRKLCDSYGFSIS